MIGIRRAYDKPGKTDGVRYLVDRLWPRGVTRADLKVEAWLKDAAPSQSLRRWFNHDPKKWDEFRKRYFAELDANPEAWKALAEAANKSNTTLVYGARDTEHNNSVALAQYLKKRLKSTE